MTVATLRDMAQNAEYTTHWIKLAMLVVRQAQLEVFTDARRELLGERILAFIREKYSAQCAAFSEADLRGLVAIALKRSRQHGFNAHADILRWINVMFTLGCNFDEDPDFPWAQEILADRALRPASKVDMIVGRTLDHLQSLTEVR
jgi:hypothetical protein